MGKNIYVTEKQFSKILLKEQELLTEHMNEVYQLDTAISLIEKQWSSPDDFWYVYISQRYKDNLNNFQKARVASSHGYRVNFIAWGIVSGNTKTEAINNLKHIDMNINDEFQTELSTKGNRIKVVHSYRDISGVILLCNKFNARCYMTINKRSMTDANNYAQDLKARGKEKGKEFQFAAGRQMTHDDRNIKWTVIRPWGLIDCDIDDPKVQAELEAYLAKNNIKYEFKYESHDGMHYLFSTRDAEKLDFSYFDKYRPGGNTRRKSDPMVLFKGDACMMVYSACGY